MEIRLKTNGLSKTVATGFSWKFTFFGVLYTMSRGDFKGLLMQLVIGMVTCGFAFLVFPFTYNKAYIKRLISQGYKPADNPSKTWLELNLNYIDEA
jgi:hypothetical protein